MEITISVILAYLLIGLDRVSAGLDCPVLDKPMWALRPTIGNIILVVLLWPIMGLYPYSSRAIAFGISSIILYMGVGTGFIWCCITVSVYIFDSTAIRIVTTVILIVVGGRFVAPLLASLMVCLTLLIAWPLDLLFPLEKKSDVQEIKSGNDHKVKHTGISRLITIENELKNKKNIIDTKNNTGHLDSP